MMRRPSKSLFGPLHLVLPLLTLLAGCHHKRPAAPSSASTAPTTHPAPIVRVPPAQSAKDEKPAAPPHPPILPEDAKGKPVLTEVGLASWYGAPYPGRKAADGTVFDPNALTAAHRTLPLGSIVRVTNLTTNESELVRITDRGPFVPGRMLDLSLAAAKAIGVYRMGIAKVKIEAYAKPDADPEGHWCVQIGAFLDHDDAIQLKNDLIHRYANAKVIEFAGATGHWVRINPDPPTRKSADKIASSIHVPDAEPYLVRLN